jgi:hypothetical protein
MITQGIQLLRTVVYNHLLMLHFHRVGSTRRDESFLLGFDPAMKSGFELLFVRGKL